MRNKSIRPEGSPKKFNWVRLNMLHYNYDRDYLTQRSINRNEGQQAVTVRPNLDFSYDSVPY
jgi:hypothetical protein